MIYSFCIHFCFTRDEHIAAVTSTTNMDILEPQCSSDAHAGCSQHIYVPSNFNPKNLNEGKYELLSRKSQKSMEFRFDSEGATDDCCVQEKPRSDGYEDMKCSNRYINVTELKDQLKCAPDYEQPKGRKSGEDN